MIDRLARPWWSPAAVLAAIAIAAAWVLFTAGPASGHATLIRTDPAQGAVLESAPERIRFTFNEENIGTPEGVQVFDAQGGEIESSATVRGSVLEVDLTEEVGDGTLVVVWRVVSEDGHPVGGSLSFSVGAPSGQVEQPPTSSAPISVPWGLSLVRWLGYVGLLVATGLVGFTLLFLPASHLADRARHRLVNAARTAAIAAAVAWLAALPLTVVYQVGDVSSLTRSAAWTALPRTEYGVTAAVMVGVALAVGLLGRGLPTRPRGRAAVAASAVAASAPALTGHTRAASPEALVIGADMIHLLAGSVWLGGLVALALALPDLSGRGTMAAEVLVRFSGVAAGILVVLVATGSVLTWRILGSWSALGDTGYGQLLLVKIAVAMIAVLIAAWNRFKLLPGLQQASRRRERRAGVGLLVRSTVVEAVVLVVVLAVTALVVDRSPEAEAAPADTSRTGVQTERLGEFEVKATVAPLTTGPNTVTIETRDSAGEPVEGLEAPRARLSSGQINLGTVPVENIGPGTYTAQVVVPTPGTWQLQVSLRTSKFDNPATTLEFTVGRG